MHETPLRASTLPLMAHPQAPRDLLRAHVARSPLSLPHSATPISPPPSIASTSSHSTTPISSPSSETPISLPLPVTPIPPPKSKTPLSPLSMVTPTSPPTSVYGSSTITPSSPEEAFPSNANALGRSDTMSSTLTMADSLPDTDYIAPISTPTPTSERRRSKGSSVSVFAGASGVTIMGGNITTAGGSIIRGKVLPEIEYPEYSEDEKTEVSTFQDVNGMTSEGTLRIVSTGGDVISGFRGASLPMRRRRNVNVHTFTGARDIKLGNVEMLNAGEDVVLG